MIKKPKLKYLNLLDNKFFKSQLTSKFNFYNIINFKIYNLLKINNLLKNNYLKLKKLILRRLIWIKKLKRLFLNIKLSKIIKKKKKYKNFFKYLKLIKKNIKNLILDIYVYNYVYKYFLYFLKSFETKRLERFSINNLNMNLNNITYYNNWIIPSSKIFNLLQYWFLIYIERFFFFFKKSLFILWLDKINYNKDLKNIYLHKNYYNFDKTNIFSLDFEAKYNINLDNILNKYTLNLFKTPLFRNCFIFNFKRERADIRKLRFLKKEMKWKFIKNIENQIEHVGKNYNFDYFISEKNEIKDKMDDHLFTRRKPLNNYLKRKLRNYYITKIITDKLENKIASNKLYQYLDVYEDLDFNNINLSNIKKGLIFKELKKKLILLKGDTKILNLYLNRFKCDKLSILNLFKYEFKSKKIDNFKSKLCKLSKKQIIYILDEVIKKRELKIMNRNEKEKEIIMTFINKELPLRKILNTSAYWDTIFGSYAKIKKEEDRIKNKIVFEFYKKAAFIGTNYEYKLKRFFKEPLIIKNKETNITKLILSNRHIFGFKRFTNLLLKPKFTQFIRENSINLGLNNRLEWLEIKNKKLIRKTLKFKQISFFVRLFLNYDEFRKIIIRNFFYYYNGRNSL